MSSSPLISRLRSVSRLLPIAALCWAGTAAIAPAHAAPGAAVKQSEPESIPALPAGDTRFSCQMVDGQYTVVYSPQSQPDQFYPWATPTELGGGWTPDRRCNEISRRLEFYRPDGLLELRTGTENGYNTICVTTQANAACRIVLTVPPGQDPLLTRDRVFENLAVADSGQQTDAVVTYQGDDDRLLQQIGEVLNLGLPTQMRRSPAASIPLRPFLDQADGGTGTQLRNRATPAPNRLNPDNFR